MNNSTATLLQLDLQSAQPVAFFAVEDGLRKHRELLLPLLCKARIKPGQFVLKRFVQLGYFDNRSHFLHSIGKTDGKVTVLLYVAVRTIVFLLQKIRSFSQKKTQNVALYS